MMWSMRRRFDQFPAQLRVAEELYPDVKFHAMREHGGKVFGDKA